MENEISAGLGGGKTEPADYFYLVYDSASATITPESKKAYFKLGVTTGDGWVFVIVDDGADNRLRDALRVSDDGLRLYKKIQASLPCFVIANGRLRVNSRLKEAVVHPIKDFDRDLEVIYDRMGVRPPTERRKLVVKLRQWNDLIKAQPNLFGFGLDLNKFVARLIDRIDPDIVDTKPTHKV